MRHQGFHNTNIQNNFTFLWDGMGFCAVQFYYNF